MAGTGHRGCAPHATVQQALVRGVRPAFAAGFGHHGQSGITTRQLEQRTVGDLRAAQVLPGAALVVGEAGEGLKSPAGSGE